MIEKKYEHLEVEKGKYERWLEQGYFKSGKRESEPYSIVIPPPNVTGKLHLGHAWDTTLQDIIIRYKRMDGFDVLWLPGMDHAGIATQAKVDAKLREEGINPRSIGREKWLTHAWDWKEKYALNIRSQWSKLGLSLDYDKERFTLDEGLSKAVNKVFIDLYNKGLIYRGERIINWDPKAMTALSNEEVIHKDVEGAFYHIRYYIENTNDYVIIATTRPETLFGDTAVAVNPKDERYKDLVGKNLILPIANVTIPVIADSYVEMDFGTGLVKITPAHDPNDFEVGNRHNLERKVCIKADGTMNENALMFDGMDRFECRRELIKLLEEKNLLEKVEKITHSVGHSERTDVIVEPYLSKQWFVKMRPLADRVLENQKDKKNKVNFVPSRFEKIMNHWMEITYDWCISRQLWWGHQIPAWYKDDEVFVGYDAPGDDWTRDSDVLDTWFSSALWPFSTLGWPNETSLLDRYYPNNCLVTAYDIIPFWVNRMTFQGLEFTNKRPFKDCLIHGLIRDKDGIKMSKSLGNGVDPMEEIEKYGADSLRYFLATNSAPGQDLRYDEEKVSSTWNFVNKLWNASRFVMMNLEEFELGYNVEDLSVFDKWILTKMNKTIDNVRKHMEKYEFNIVGSEIYEFAWNDFCDWYIEFSKTNMNNTTKNVLREVLINILKMLHPFMPYVTEEIFLSLTSEESIMISNYPKNNGLEFASDFVSQVQEVIVRVRNAKSELNIPKGFIMETDIDAKDIFEKLLKCTFEGDKENLIRHELVFSFGNVTLYFEKVVDENLIFKLQNEKETLEKSILKRETLLANEGYTSKAPSNIVLMDREKLAEEKLKLETVKSQLENL